jgi:hypothetical protein
MKQKKILGAVLFSVGIGALVYLYKGFYAPKKEIEYMPIADLKKQETTTTKK